MLQLLTAKKKGLVKMKRNYIFPQMTITKFSIPLSCSKLQASTMVVTDDGIGKITPPGSTAAVNARLSTVTDIVSYNRGGK